MPILFGEWRSIPTKGLKRAYHVDDLVDRLNHTYTTFLLVALAVLVLTKIYVGDPIHCWLPAELEHPSGMYGQYVNRICWVQNKYLVPFYETIPLAVTHREESEINYYQWVFLILLFQSVLFKCPNVFWRLLTHRSEIPFEKICEYSHKTQEDKPSERQQTIENIGDILMRWLHFNRRQRDIKNRPARGKRLYDIISFLCLRSEGKYLVCLYLTIKLTYVVNVIAQFFLLSAFLGYDYGMYGFNFVEMLRDEKLTGENIRFPTEVLCDYEIRQLSNIQRYTVQCVIPVNLFNKFIFLFLWFWFFILAVFSCYSFLKWSYLFVLRRNNYNFVRKYIKLRKLQTGYDKKLWKQFALKYLRDDGCFVIKMIEMNSNYIVVMDLLKYMMEKFQQETTLENSADGPVQLSSQTELKVDMKKQ